jgi:PAS domain S-box-containing protein
VANRETDYNAHEISFIEDIALYISPIMNARMERDRKETERRHYEDELRKHQHHLEELVTSRTEELRNEHDRIAAIIRSVADGVIVTDLNQKVIMMNATAEELLGISFHRVKNQPISLVIHEQTLREKLKSVMNKLKTEYEFDFILHKSHNGSDRIMHGKTSVIIDRNSNKLGTVTVISDVTHEREIDRMKTEFIYTAAHELRTPLTSIQGFSEILLTRDNLSHDEHKKYLRLSIPRLLSSQLLGNILDIARIESGRVFIKRQNCAVKHL